MFETTRSTLLSGGSGDSFFAVLLLDDWDASKWGSFFLDRNPECFSALLHLLRSGDLLLSAHIDRDMLLKEAEFYGWSTALRAAARPKLDGDRLRHSYTVNYCSQSPVPSKLIRSSPSGAFSTAHGSVLRTYNDWNFRMCSPLRLGHKKEFLDVSWCDDHHIVASVADCACETKSIQIVNPFMGIISPPLSSYVRPVDSCGVVAGEINVTCTLGQSSFEIFSFESGRNFLEIPLHHLRNLRVKKLRWRPDDNVLLSIMEGPKEILFWFDVRGGIGGVDGEVLLKSRMGILNAEVRDEYSLYVIDECLRVYSVVKLSWS